MIEKCKLLFWDLGFRVQYIVGFTRVIEMAHYKLHVTPVWARVNISHMSDGHGPLVGTL